MLARSGLARTREGNGREARDRVSLAARPAAAACFVQGQDDFVKFVKTQKANIAKTASERRRWPAGNLPRGEETRVPASYRALPHTLPRGLMLAPEPLQDPPSRAASGGAGRGRLSRLLWGWGKGVGFALKRLGRSPLWCSLLSPAAPRAQRSRGRVHSPPP